MTNAHKGLLVSLNSLMDFSWLWHPSPVILLGRMWFSSHPRGRCGFPEYFFKRNYLCIYFWLCRVLCCCVSCLVAVLGLLNAVASLVVGMGCRARASVVTARGLSRSMACGSLLRPGIKPMSLALASGFPIPGHQESPCLVFNIS